uniref:Uncharacterized protein n=1 Tax=Arion vulgaris TaxID=1028688 RepID=A0A0B7B9J3_9EUPU
MYRSPTENNLVVVVKPPGIMSSHPVSICAWGRVPGYLADPETSNNSRRVVLCLVLRRLLLR